MILSDRDILWRLSLSHSDPNHLSIIDFLPVQTKPLVGLPNFQRPGPSAGLASYGYDMRVRNRFKIFDKHSHGIIDPTRFDEAGIRLVEADDVTGFIMAPQSFALAESVERFRIPRDCHAQVFGKSTYARCGLIVNFTPLEPEWEGTVTIELFNGSDRYLRVWPGCGIAQVCFMSNPGGCRVSYADKGGKYQNQSGIQGAK